MQEDLQIQKLQQGDQASFREFVEHYKDRVYNTCLGFVRNPEDAEDLAQDVFVEVHLSVGSFRGDAGLATWLYRIAVNKSLEHLRKKKAKKRWAFIQSLFGGAEGEELSVPDQSFHPGIALENKERAGILMAAIQQLPEQQQVAFTLHKLEGLSYDEIARVMEVSLAAVESLMFRAKKNLQKQLTDYYQKNEKK